MGREWEREGEGGAAVLAGGRLEREYRLGPRLGKGHSGVVRICEKLDTGELLACKSISKRTLKTPSKRHEVAMEVAAMQRLRTCEGGGVLVQLRALSEDRAAVHLLLDLCAEGDLFDHLSRTRRLPEQEAAFLLRQVASALQLCALNGVIHRDVKPENIFISGFSLTAEGSRKPHVKLGDFGLAVALPRGVTTSRGLAGSCLYMAPELVLGRDYDCGIDIWSLGVTMYAALAGYLPFWGEDNCGIFASICSGEPDYEQHPWPLISAEAKHLVRWMLTHDPSKRASAEDILSHPFILSHCPPPPSPKPATPSPSPTSRRLPLPVTSLHPSLRPVRTLPQPRFPPSLSPPSPAAMAVEHSAPSQPSSKSSLSPISPLSPYSHFSPYSPMSPPSPISTPFAVPRPHPPSSPRSPTSSPSRHTRPVTTSLSPSHPPSLSPSHPPSLSPSHPPSLSPSHPPSLGSSPKPSILAGRQSQPYKSCLVVDVSAQLDSEKPPAVDLSSCPRGSRRGSAFRHFGGRLPSPNSPLDSDKIDPFISPSSNRVRVFKSLFSEVT